MRELSRRQKVYGCPDTSFGQTFGQTFGQSFGQSFAQTMGMYQTGLSQPTEILA